MKIECTEEEKDAILNIVETNATHCIFDNSPNIKCDYTIQCVDCAEKNIEWRIINEVET